MKTRTDLLIFLRPFRILLIAFALLLAGPGQGYAQDEAATNNQKINRLTLEARLTKEGQAIENGLEWRIFGQNLGQDGKLPLLAEAFGGIKTFDITQGDYLVHVAYGHAALVRKVSVGDAATTIIFELNAGGLKLDAIAAIDTPIPAKYLKFDVYDSEQNEFGERKLIARAVSAGEIIPFPAGTYHVISRFGETNAEIGADLRVQPGKVTAANLEHRAAVLTFRLVSSAGGDAIADTSWSILTESGDLITESRSTFPTMVLAEGTYSAIAKHKGTIYSTNFEVRSGVFGDIEVLAIN
ncbi:MAG: hypothetical protein COB78_10545 [Hyphomicrobiales bacterium]|nr:MAG: hypothetical protein COB78_10545 [Hyphomicrobiales bacterium]